MASSTDFANIPGMTKEMREGVIAAFDALSHWRDEIETANERCLGKVLDHTSQVARSMGWPDQAVNTTRQYLQNISKMQVETIDQIVDAWKEQLKSATSPMAMPRNFSGQASGPAAASEFNPFAPWTFWMQAAEMWQRTWMPETQSRRGARSH
jgi:ribulose kinase